MSSQYGTKDIMRLTDLKKKSGGDLVEAIKLAIRMSNEIETPGKAMARGYAARDVFQNNYSPVAAVFFSRACELSGEDDIHNIDVMASMNSVGEDEDAIENAYSQIPIEKQPASRRPKETWEKATTFNRRGFSDISPLAKINVVKGSGAGFEMKYMRNGTFEVWKTPDLKYRLVYTGNSLPLSMIGEQKDFKFEGKRETWEMVDYIEVYNMMNLQPLYGSSLTSFMYS
jgi:hypothetical protein